MEGKNVKDNNNLSDIMEVIQNDVILGNDDMEMEGESRNLFSPGIAHPQNKSQKPYIEILEQPASGIRFRYEIEGRSAGSIPGERSRPDKKTYPTIRVVGFKGKMLVVVSCVTVEENPNNPPRPHPHKLVGRVENCKNGVCRVRLKGDDDMTVSFPNLGIQCVRRKDVETSLSERQKEKVDPFGTGFDHKKSHTNLALNTVRLCFQGFIPKKINGAVSWEVLDPVVSNPIIEKKATCTLSIHKLSHYCASVGGGLEMILLCDKVPKDDIQIRFYEERDGLVIWEGYGDFQPTQVHHQYAISFRTPKYDNTEIKEPVKVNIQLKLKSKDQYGPSLDFEMLPLANNDGIFKPKRKSPMDLMSENLGQIPEKRFKTLDYGLQEYIKVEMDRSPAPINNDRISPNPHCAGPSSPQHLMSFRTYQPEHSPESHSPSRMSYNIPLDQNVTNLHDRYKFPATVQPDSEQPQPLTFRSPVQNSFMDLPSQMANNVPFERVESIYATPNELNLDYKENTSMMDLDNQQFLTPPTNNRTLELINAILDGNTFSQEFDNSLQITAPAPQPQPASEPEPQPNEMTDSLTRLTRDIQCLNEMYRPNILD